MLPREHLQGMCRRDGLTSPSRINMTFGNVEILHSCSNLLFLLNERGAARVKPSDMAALSHNLKHASDQPQALSLGAHIQLTGWA